MEEKKTFTERFTIVAAKFGQQIHLRSLRDAFAVMMPLFILAGVGVLINNVVFPLFLKGDSLTNIQYRGNSIANATLNASSLLLCFAIGYCLSKNKGFQSPITAALMSVASLIVMMPQTVKLVSIKGKDFSASGALSFANIGTTAMFGGIIIGLLATELFIKLTKIEKLKINMGENVPPSVSSSFNTMIPLILTLIIFSVLSTILYLLRNMDLISMITTMIQEPLRKINTSLAGTILIYSLGNLLFGFGIHQTVINGTILEPLLLVNMNENMAAFAAGKEVPHIINSAFVPTFGMIGGTGSTLCLLLAVMIFYRKNQQYKKLADLAITPGIFNINEPVIFGFPIVFNLPMIIPFVILPVIGILIGYFATAIGFMNKCVVLVPWTTPPIVNAFLATGMDYRAIIVQLIIIVIGVILYLPFIKISQKAQQINVSNDMN